MRTGQDGALATRPLAARHVAIGWWSIALFGTLGLVLETLHGFKAGFYLDVGNETRRLMWTLAHAHGTLLGLVHIAFAVSLPVLPGTTAGMVARHRRASQALIGASVLLPVGFFLAGIRFYAGDPGIGIVLVPVGAALLVAGAVMIAGSMRKSG